MGEQRAAWKTLRGGVHARVDRAPRCPPRARVSPSSRGFFIALCASHIPPALRLAPKWERPASKRPAVRLLTGKRRVESAALSVLQRPSSHIFTHLTDKSGPFCFHASGGGGSGSAANGPVAAEKKYARVVCQYTDAQSTGS
jgi:hypothetical protein